MSGGGADTRSHLARAVVPGRRGASERRRRRRSATMRERIWRRAAAGSRPDESARRPQLRPSRPGRAGAAGSVRRDGPSGRAPPVRPPRCIVIRFIVRSVNNERLAGRRAASKSITEIYTRRVCAAGRRVSLCRARPAGLQFTLLYYVEVARRARPSSIHTHLSGTSAAPACITIQSAKLSIRRRLWLISEWTDTC